MAPHKAGRDAAILSVVQARSRLENVMRVASRRPESSSARRMLTILDVLSPIVSALEQMLSDPDEG